MVKREYKTKSARKVFLNTWCLEKWNPFIPKTRTGKKVKKRRKEQKEKVVE